MNSVWAASVAAVLITSLPATADATEAPVEIQRSHSLPITPDGRVIIAETWGEIDLKAWDRPTVEVTMTARTKSGVSEKESEKARGQLERFGFEAKASGPDEVKVIGIAPSSSLLKPFGGKDRISIQYTIKMPRNAHLKLDHKVGEVRVAGLAGNIQVANKTGSVTLAVPATAEATITTSTRIGDAELPAALLANGNYRRRALVGHSFTYQPHEARRQVDIRVGIGSIEID